MERYRIGMSRALMVFVVSVFCSFNVQAMSLGDYLVVGQVSGSIAKAVQVGSDLELGAVTDLQGNDPLNIPNPGVAPTVGPNNITYDGNVAITNENGTVQMSDINVYGDIGIDCEGGYVPCTDDGANLSGNVFYDDAAPVNLRAISENDGVQGDIDLVPLVNQINVAKNFLNNVNVFDIFIQTDDGNINNQDIVINLNPGQNFISFNDMGNPLGFEKDITLTNSNLVFQGNAGDSAVIIAPNGSNVVLNQSNMVIGDGGIGLDAVLFASLTQDNDTHFNLNDVLLNGVALFDLGMGNGGIDFDNVAGCTQVVGDVVDFNNISLQRCGFDTTTIPVPPAVWLFGSALGLLGWVRARQAS